jgi:nicotinate phosphoribosyltransferase
MTETNAFTPIIITLLDLDFYKLTMSQHQWKYHRRTFVRFGFTNRTKVRLADFVNIEELRAQIAHVRTLKVTDKEIEYLAKLKGKSGRLLFDRKYLTSLRNKQLPPVSVEVVDGQFKINTIGVWWAVTLWETLIMSILNELYFIEVVKRSGETLAAVFEEGMKRLDRKIERLKEWPSIRFSDFGSRRRFSKLWQKVVYACLEAAFGNESRFLGTSNVALSMEYDRMPIGTWAHEETMVIAALADDSDETLRASQAAFMREWEELYGIDLLIALSDTFGSEAFFEDFKEFAKTWGGMRHDSGDPFEFGEAVIAYYESLGIDPMTKAIVFSDGLTDQTITELFYRFQNRIWMVFGWGTNLTNDLGFDALSIVMKAMAARLDNESTWHLTTKLSDNPKKAMSEGGQPVIDRYIRVFGAKAKKAVKVVY